MEEIVQRILEAARAEGGDCPGAAFVPTASVIRRALEAASDLSPASDRALADDTHPMTPAAERYHEVLARLVYNGPAYAGPLLEGQGNFGAVCCGHPDYPPAHPRYTECRITQRGLDYLRATAEPGAAPSHPPQQTAGARSVSGTRRPLRPRGCCAVSFGEGGAVGWPDGSRPSGPSASGSLASAAAS